MKGLRYVIVFLTGRKRRINTVKGSGDIITRWAMVSWCRHVMVSGCHPSRFYQTKIMPIVCV
jgi:hypothetical protein